MIEASAAAMAKSFHEFLGKVQDGETVIIHKHGMPVARLVPASGFMSGKAAADLFRTYRASKLDKEAAKSIREKITELDNETENALAH